MTGLNEAFVIDTETRNRLIAEDPNSAEIIKPFLAGRDVKRYMPPQSSRWLIFARRGISIEEYPAIERHLLQYKTALTPKPRDWRGSNWKGRKPGFYAWYEIQDTVDYYSEFQKPKIMLPDISIRGNFMLDAEGDTYCVNTVYMLCSDSRLLLGILNSKMSTFSYRNLSVSYRGGYLRFWTQYLSQLPIRTIDFDNPEEVAQHDRLVSLVERMLDLNARLADEQNPESLLLLQTQIDATDRQIDQLVYELYDLTADEIALVEQSA